MQTTHFLTPATVIVALLLGACGGGGGGSTPAQEPAPAPVTSLASLAAKDIPAQWPDSFKSVTVQKADLVTDTELAQTTNTANKIFIHVWYLDKDLQRQDVAILTLDALMRLGGSLPISRVPGAVKLLKSEVYTAKGTAKDAVQQTLASKEIAV